MRCNICGNEISGYGNNPAPLCAPDDIESRCCDICNGHVIRARLFGLKYKKIKPNIGDTVVIFYSKGSTAPIDILNNNGQFLAGEVTDEASQENCFEGSWGNFLLDVKNDSFVIADDI